MSDDIKGAAWNDSEIDLVVSDYFSMLANEISGLPYNKSEHRRLLIQAIKRSAGSIERKRHNISAVLVRIGLPWIKGYKPLFNFQNALVDGVDRYLEMKGTPVFEISPKTETILAEPEDLLMGPPPAPPAEEGKEASAVRRLIRKFDPAARDARNRLLGKHGEELVLKHERLRLTSAGRNDLANKLEWTSEVRGDGAGYDIRSFNFDGSDRLLEVKTTNGSSYTPFFISENERSFSIERKDAFRLVRLYNFYDKPAGFELTAPLENWVQLAPTAYRATF
jgi:Domain of unknown function (DUF3883)